jgi:hypothetical protein
MAVTSENEHREQAFLALIRTADSNKQERPDAYDIGNGGDHLTICNTTRGVGRQGIIRQHREHIRSLQKRIPNWPDGAALPTFLLKLRMRWRDS